ncbi:MAG: hypothetical protein IKI83_04960 [Prevotella sp.]|nr:hypothetical protein [Prevotella sp.]
MHTIGIARDESEIEPLRQKGQEWIRQRELEVHPELDLYGEERRACESEIEIRSALWPTSTTFSSTVRN